MEKGKTMETERRTVIFQSEISAHDQCMCDACHGLGYVVKLKLPRTKFFDGSHLSTKHDTYWLCRECRDKLVKALKWGEDEVREFAADVAYQFGYYGQYNGRLHIGNGGLSTLEWAFDILGWENPHPVPECECEIDGCHEHATCGSSTKDGYKRMCGRHMREKTAQADSIDFDYAAED